MILCWHRDDTQSNNGAVGDAFFRVSLLHIEELFVSLGDMELPSDSGLRLYIPGFSGNWENQLQLCWGNKCVCPGCVQAASLVYAGTVISNYLLDTFYQAAKI